jgi:hypothetical protein
LDSKKDEFFQYRIFEIIAASFCSVPSSFNTRTLVVIFGGNINALYETWKGYSREGICGSLNKLSDGRKGGSDELLLRIDELLILFEEELVELLLLDGEKRGDKVAAAVIVGLPACHPYPNKT